MNPVVAVCGPDTRDPENRAFELRENELCVGEMQNHYVFAAPSKMALPLHLDVIAEFSLMEAICICHRLLNRSFVLVSPDAQKYPAKGVMLEFSDWFSINFAKLSTTVPNSSSIRPHSLYRGLFIGVNQKSSKAVFTPIVFYAHAIAAFKNALFRVGSWHSKVWQNSVGLIPDEHVEAYRFSPDHETVQEFPQYASEITTRQKLLLLINHFFNHWESQNLKLDARAEMVATLLGSKMMSRTNMSNALAEADCANPSLSQAKRRFTTLRKEARQYLKAHPDDASYLMECGPLGDNILRLLLVVLFPSIFGEEIQTALGRPMWDCALPRRSVTK